jgi:hypothetical protein
MGDPATAGVAPVKYLIRDWDGEYLAKFDTILANAVITVVHTGVRVPRMNAMKERWIPTCRREPDQR